MLEICSDLSKTGLKIYYFCQHSKKAKIKAKWQNHFISGKQFQTRPNGNPAENLFRITWMSRYYLRKCTCTKKQKLPMRYSCLKVKYLKKAINWDIGISIEQNYYFETSLYTPQIGLIYLAFCPGTYLAHLWS